MKRAYFAMLSILLAIGVCIVVSFGWFTNTEFVEPEISGYSISAYFAGGDGSSSDPFQIKTPRHLYNLAWLQYLGYFNKKGSGNQPNESNTETMTQYCFVIEENLDMDGWPLPPIGTTYRPFIGVLNVKGHVIENLLTSNIYSDFEDDATDMHKHPSTIDSSAKYINAEVIGFIGVIGKTSDTGINTIDTSENAMPMELNQGLTVEPTVTNITLLNNEVKSNTNNVLIGSVAGYVNGTVSNVGIKGSTLNVSSRAVVQSINNKIKNLSDYSVVGYAEDAYTTAKTVNNTTIFNPTTTYDHFTYYGMGNSDNWGGSIDMLSLYTRINARTNSKLTSYTSSELHYYNQDGTKSSKESITETSTPTPYHNTSGITDFYNDKYGSSGSYLTFDTAPTTNTTGYDYLTGLYKDVISVKTNGTANGYTLKNPGGNYLNLSSSQIENTTNFEVSVSSSKTNSTAWIIESSGSNYTISTYNEDDGIRYYLGTSDYAELTLSTSTFEWKFDSNYGYFTTYNGTNRYIRYVSNQWIVTDRLAYYITDNSGNYLTRSGNGITNVTDYTQATKWIFENEATKSGIIYDESNTGYKLYVNGTTLSAETTNATRWENDGSNIYSGPKYLIFDGNNWTIYQQNQYYIKYGNYYLSLDNNGSIINNMTDDSNATLWTFSNTTTNLQGYISTVINGTTYYLRYNNGLTTSTTNTTSWLNDGESLYYSNNNTDYYIQYVNNAWVAAEKEFLGYQVSVNGNMLNGGDLVYFRNYNNNYYLYYIDDENNTTYFNVARSKNNPGNAVYYNKYYYYLSETTSFSNTGRIFTYYESGNNIYLRAYYNQYFYLTYNNGWTITTTATPFTLTEVYSEYTPTLVATSVPYTTINEISKLNMSREGNASVTTFLRTQKTVPSVFNYIPLNTDDNYNVKDTNTGYIMSGGHSGASGSGELTGVDIRVAGYAEAYTLTSRLSVSVNANGTIKTNQVYYYNGSEMTTINDSNNSFVKYAASRERMEQTLIDAYNNNNGRVGGIHFITSLISMDNLVTAPSVIINGTEHTNYQMPENSIDFNLKSKGYINFFATLFYPGNTTFFSLNEIIRDEETQQILSINHIKEIYQSSDKSLDYIYKYESIDPTTNCIYSNGNQSLPSGYTKIYDSTWIESPNIGAWDNTTSKYMKKLYYYEIPVNKGEYALGSVYGRDGGYLLYLDIGANAAAVDRTEITQKTVTTTSDYKYVNGIQILDANASTSGINAANSAVAIIPAVAQGASAIGEVTISRTDDTITFSKSLESTYLGQGITGSNLTLTPLTTPTSTVDNVLKYYDYNRTIDTLYVTTVTNNGTSNTGYTVYKILSDSNVFIVDQTASDKEILSKEYGLLKINASGGGEAVALANVSVNPSSTRPDLDYECYVDTAKKDDINTTVEMNIEAIPDSGTTIITNVDSSATVTAQYVFNNGTTLLADEYLIEYGYMLTGDTVTVTLTGDNQVKIKINESQNYTFKINGTTATTSSDNIYTIAPTSNG